MDQENSHQSINETYKIWKKHCPFLYNAMQTYQLNSCSQTIDWFDEDYIENDWKIKSLLIGSNSLVKNAVYIVNIGLPTDQALTDYTSYREDKPDMQLAANGYVGTIGQQQLNIKIALPQSSQIMKARINHVSNNSGNNSSNNSGNNSNHQQSQHLIAIKTGGSLPQVLIYDLRNKEDELQENSIKLSGHLSQGYGLDWGSNHRLLSGSYDKKILIWDIQSQQSKPVLQFECQSPVEDTKWAKCNQHLFASASQDQRISLFDSRDSSRKPTLTKKAHTGEIYSIDFSPFSQNLLLSGGEDCDVNLWDLRNMNKKINAFVGHNDSISSISFSPHSPLQFASGSFDRRIVIWDMNGINLNTKEKQGNQILFIHGGHRSKVTDLSWCKEKQFIGSVEENHTMQVWRMNQRIQSQ